MLCCTPDLLTTLLLQKPLRRRLEGDADLQNVLEHDPLRLRMV